MYDIYTILILKFVEQNPQFEGNKYLSRKYFKKTIMSINYNITCWSSFNYFKAAIEDHLGQHWIKKTPLADLKNLHDCFYNFMQTEVFATIYKKDKDAFLKKTLQQLTSTTKHHIYFAPVADPKKRKKERTVTYLKNR